jgi:hypothetical protein
MSEEKAEVVVNEGLIKLAAEWYKLKKKIKKFNVQNNAIRQIFIERMNGEEGLYGDFKITNRPQSRQSVSRKDLIEHPNIPQDVIDQITKTSTFNVIRVSRIAKLGDISYNAMGEIEPFSEEYTIYKTN